jgi:hypothetical protein
MAKSLDTMTLDFEDNEDVYNMFAGSTTGDTLDITVQATVNEISENQISVSIDGVETVNNLSEDEVGEEIEVEDEEYEEYEEEEEEA